jgi:hypothetical protein
MHFQSTGLTNSLWVANTTSGGLPSLMATKHQNQYPTTYIYINLPKDLEGCETKSSRGRHQEEWVLNRPYQSVQLDSKMIYCTSLASHYHLPNGQMTKTTWETNVKRIQACTIDSQYTYHS